MAAADHGSVGIGVIHASPGQAKKREVAQCDKPNLTPAKVSRGREEEEDADHCAKRSPSLRRVGAFVIFTYILIVTPQRLMATRELHRFQPESSQGAKILASKCRRLAALCQPFPKVGALRWRKDLRQFRRKRLFHKDLRRCDSLHISGSFTVKKACACNASNEFGCHR